MTVIFVLLYAASFLFMLVCSRRVFHTIVFSEEFYNKYIKGTKVDGEEVIVRLLMSLIAPLALTFRLIAISLAKVWGE